MPLRYLTFVGEFDLLSKADLARLALIRRGNREDLTTVGGSKSKKAADWKNTKKDIFEEDKTKI